MKNNLRDLNDYLFEQIERLSDDSLTEEQLNLQLKKTETINRVADQIIKNADMQFKAMKMCAEYGVINENQVKTFLIESKKDEIQ